MQQSETFFRQGASGEMSSINVQSKGRASVLGSNPFQLGWRVSDRYAASEGWNYFKPQELYFEYKKPQWSIAVGAKHMDSLRASDAWSNPIWFARFREDKINMQTIGPVGLHASAVLPAGWRVHTSLIAAHIPDFGPHQTIENGKFVSRNPWFRPPPEQIILDLSTPTTRAVQYQIAPYKIEDIAGKPGAIVQVEKKINSNQNLKFVGARKALPALHLSFPVVYRQLDNDAFLDLVINPASVYHTAAAIEWSYQNNPDEANTPRALFVTFQYENPDVVQRPKNWISQTFNEAYVASAGYKQVVSAGSLPLGLEISYWQVWGGDGPDKGEDASTRSVFDRRYDFIQAVKIGASVQKGRYVTSSSLIYDYAQQGLLWSNRFNYQINRQWAMSGLLDMLGLLGPTGQVTDGLLSLYRANDRFGLGVSYVF